MSKPRIAVFGDAIVTELNNGAWSQRGFTPTRIYHERKSQKEVRNLQVDVMVGTSEWQLVARGRRRYTHQIDVSIRQSVNPESVEAIDALMYFVEELVEFFSANETNGSGKRSISGTQGSTTLTGHITNVALTLPFSPDVLDTMGQFFSAFTLTILEESGV